MLEDDKPIDFGVSYFQTNYLYMYMVCICESAQEDLQSSLFMSGLGNHEA